MFSRFKLSAWMLAVLLGGTVTGVICADPDRKPPHNVTSDPAGREVPLFSVPPGEKVEDVLQAEKVSITAGEDAVDWSVKSLNAEAAWRKGITGKGVKVVVLDTGYFPHRDLKDGVKGSKDFTRSTTGVADMQGHGCVLGTDMLYTSLSGFDSAQNVFNKANGPRIPDDIAEIKDVRDMNIYTISANPKTGEPVKAKVEAVHKLWHSGKMFRVTTREGTVTLTPWHPIYTISSSRGKDYTITKKRADEVKLGDRILLAGKCDEVGTYQEVNGKILDEEAAYWLGLVASDGHLMKLQKSIGFSNKDAAQGDSFSWYSESLFGKAPVKYNYGGRVCSEWRLNKKEAWEFASACGIPVGKKSLTLDVPEAIKRSPRSVVMAFTAGVIEGDGCVEDRLRIATGSKKFADELVALLRMLAVSASAHECGPTTISDNISYSIRVAGDPELISHIEVKDTSRLKESRIRRSATVETIDVIDHNDYVYDLTVEGTHVYACNGHIVSNTHCAGSIGARKNGWGTVGVAYECDLYMGKVLGDNGSGRVDNIRDGILWGVNDVEADVMSLSIGGGGSENFIPIGLAAAEAKGVIVVAAAGNDGNNRPVNFPAAYPFPIAVSAVDIGLRLAGFSCTGPKVEVCGPGVNVRSTYPGPGDGLFADLSGTSMATPNVAGVAALWVQANPSVPKKERPAAFRKWLKETAKDLAPAGRDTNFGFGLPDCSKLTVEDVKPPVPDPKPNPNGGVQLDESDLNDKGKEKLKKGGFEKFKFELSPTTPISPPPAKEAPKLSLDAITEKLREKGTLVVFVGVEPDLANYPDGVVLTDTLEGIPPGIYNTKLVTKVGFSPVK